MSSSQIATDHPNWLDFSTIYFSRRLPSQFPSVPIYPRPLLDLLMGHVWFYPHRHVWMAWLDCSRPDRFSKIVKAVVQMLVYKFRSHLRTNGHMLFHFFLAKVRNNFSCSEFPLLMTSWSRKSPSEIPFSGLVIHISGNRAGQSPPSVSLIYCSVSSRAADGKALSRMACNGAWLWDG